MNAHYLTKERDRIKDRLQFIDAILDSSAPKSSVLDFQDLTECANKERKAGYWKQSIKFRDGWPVTFNEWIANRSTTECKYDRKAIDPACAKANCGRRG